MGFGPREGVVLGAMHSIGEFAAVSSKRVVAVSSIYDTHRASLALRPVTAHDGLHCLHVGGPAAAHDGLWGLDVGLCGTA